MRSISRVWAAVGISLAVITLFAAPAVSADSASLSLQDRAETLLDQSRASNTLHTSDQRKQYCTSHKKAIDAKLTALKTLADSRMQSFGSLYDKLRAYNTDAHLKIRDYDQQTRTISVKQIQASDALTTLTSTINDGVNCNAKDPALQITMAKIATDDLRDALQDYRGALAGLAGSMLASEVGLAR
jgi:hypothetical protein